MFLRNNLRHIKGSRAIDVKKLRGSAVGKKRPQHEVPLRTDSGRNYVFKGTRPEVLHRRAAPPVFLPNFDVPAEISEAIRAGDDILQSGSLTQKYLINLYE